MSAGSDSADTGAEPIELAFEARVRDLGGDIAVRRVLPFAKRRMVGPFIFLDHMGPVVFAAGDGLAVRPHPHIGLATITYLFDGEIMHRDSLGYEQLIEPGAVNLMTAGRGIVHSERASERQVPAAVRLHGVQSWTALPLVAEEIEPSFVHYPASSLPELQLAGCTVRVIMGTAYGRTSPVTTLSPTLYAEVRMPRGARLVLPDDYRERAVYVVSGRVQAGANAYGEGTLAVAATGVRVELLAAEDSRIMLVGGEPLGVRHIWWNFVSSSQSRIEQAKRDWAEDRMGKVRGDNERIPLPDR